MADFTKGLKKIPVHMWRGIKLWIESGELHGDFLRAVLSNDLKQAFFHADAQNMLEMRNWVSFMSNDLPADSWGSAEKVLYWAEHFGLRGRDVQTYYVQDGCINGVSGEMAIPAGGGDDPPQKDGWYYLPKDAANGIGPYDTKREAIVAGAQAAECAAARAVRNRLRLVDQVEEMRLA